MGMSAEEIETMIRRTIPDAQVALEDLAGDNDHFRVEVRSAAFRGKPRIAQHQMVYAALQGGMGTKLHALSIKTSIPE